VPFTPYLLWFLRNILIPIVLSFVQTHIREEPIIVLIFTLANPRKRYISSIRALGEVQDEDEKKYVSCVGIIVDRDRSGSSTGRAGSD
jgi:hypothetical protein